MFRGGALLSIVALLLAPVAPSAIAPVDGGTASTDRGVYILGMTATAHAVFNYSGSQNQVEDAAIVSWESANGTLLRSGWLAILAKGGGVAEFEDRWLTADTGVGFTATFTINRSTSDTTPVTAIAAFDVLLPTEHVIVSGLSVRVDRPYYRQGEFVTATVSVLDDPAWVFGNASRLADVAVTWRSPAGTVLRSVIIPFGGGTFTDRIYPPDPGFAFTVEAAYLGDGPVLNTTAFDVLPPALPGRSVDPGEYVFWPEDARPWRVCGDLVVADGGTLQIEAGVTVLLCPGARIVVDGRLLVDGTAAVPVRFIPEDAGAAPGTWAGIVIREGSGTSSVLRNPVVDRAQEGITAIGASPLIVGARILDAAGAGIRLTGSFASIQDSRSDRSLIGLAATDSTPTVRGFTANACLEGIELVSSAGSLEGISITGAGDNGMNLSRSFVDMDSVRIEGSTDVSLEARNSGGVWNDVTLLGGRISLRAVNTTATMESAAISGAAQRALDLTNTSLLLANGTVSSIGTDLIVFVSSLRLLESSVDVTDRLAVSSTIWVQHFLHVTAVDGGGKGLPGALVTLAGGAESWTAPTSSGGALRWQVFTEYRILPNGQRAVSSPWLNVTKAGYDTVGGNRTLDPTSSQSHQFSLRTPVPPVILPLRVSFSSVASGLTATFADASVATTGSLLLTWLWDFGDGDASTVPSPRHTYAAGGTYRVRLTVRDTSDASAVMVQDITVTAPIIDDGGDPTNPETAGLPGWALTAIAFSVAIAAAVILGLTVAPILRRRSRAKAIRALKPEPGRSYMLLDKRPDAAYDLLARQKGNGARPLVLTRSSPATMRSKHGLGEAPALWVTRTAGDGNLLPTNLGAILDAASKHLGGAPHGVVLLDGLEYLLGENDFPKVVRFLQRLADSAASHQGSVLVPFDLDTVNPQREAQMTKGFEVV